MAILTKPQVAAMVGYSPNHLTVLAKRGQFPKPFKVNPATEGLRTGKLGWLSSEVEAWISSRADTRLAT